MGIEDTIMDAIGTGLFRGAIRPGRGAWARFESPLPFGHRASRSLRLSRNQAVAMGGTANLALLGGTLPPSLTQKKMSL